jgi:TetR/AcrR family tetracycline transcriptional repressor
MAEKRTQLSRELITNVAVDVVARDGLGALSMRRLAQELDVWPMSVYRHFRDKDDLLDAVAAAGAEGVDLPPDEGSWRDQLPALAEEVRVLLARQPVDLRRRTLIGPGVLRLTDAALRVLRYVVGSIEFEAATGTERETQAAILAVPEEEHPDLSAAAEEVAHALAGGDAAFDEGLDLVLAGIAAKDG